MKLLFLTINLGGGGAERVLVNLANELANRGHTVTIRSVVNYGENIQYLDERVRFEYIYKKQIRGINYLYLLPHRYVYQKVCYGEYDIIIPFLHGMLTRVVAYAPSSQKTVAWLHSDMTKSQFMKKLIKDGSTQMCFASYDRIVAVSESVKRSFIEITGIKDNVETIYNVFDTKRILELSQEDLGSKLDNRSGIRLISVGKLEHVKGYNRLLRIFNKIYKEGKLGISLTIVGEGSERADFEHYISSQNLNDRVFLPGFDNNPYSYIRQSDLFVCSSYEEGYSSAVAESLILGVPVVSTNVSGAQELLENGEYGLIVDNTDDALFEGIKAALNNLEYWKSKAQERRQYFFSGDSVSKVERLFEGLLCEKE